MTESSSIKHDLVVADGRGSPASAQILRDHDEIDLAPYLRRLGSGWRVIIGTGLVALVVVIGVLSLLPRKYESVATLVVAQAKLDPVVPAAAPFRILFQNYGLAAEVTSRFQLDAPPFGLTPHEFLRTAVRVDEIRGLNVLQVRVALRDDPQRAAAVANAMADGAMKLSQRINEDEAHLKATQLKGTLESTRSRLDSAEQSLRQRREQLQMEVRKNDASTALTQRGVLLPLYSIIMSERARLAQAEQDLAKQTRIVDVARRPAAASALFDLAKADAAAHAKADAAARAKADTATRDDDRTLLGANAAAHAKADAAAPDDERALLGLNLQEPSINPVYEALQYQVALSRSRLAGMESQRRALESEGLGKAALTQFKGLYSEELELERLESAQRLLKRLYEDVALQYEQARVSVAAKSAQLQVIDRAVPPDTPLSRGRAAGGAIAGLLGALFGSLFVLASPRYSAARRGDWDSRT